MHDVTWLFVPGDRPERFEKAARSGCDQVICDLEDAVASDAKASARNHVAAYLSDVGPSWVRVNAPASPWYMHDLDAVAATRGVQGIVVPKAEDPELLSAIARSHPGLPLIALLETALGVHLAVDIAAAAGVVRLAFGSVDYALDLGMREVPANLVPARHILVAASRIAGLTPPLDGVTTVFHDADLVRTEAIASRDMGFGGKLCIHPAQVPLVAQAFRPDPDEIRWAERIIASANAGAASQLEGAMIDAPVVERARRILRTADRSTTPG